MSEPGSGPVGQAAQAGLPAAGGPGDGQARGVVVARRDRRRLRIEFPTDPMMWVSHETIYQALFVQGRGELRRELARCLRNWASGPAASPPT
jgi:hypothetical protein